MAETKCSSSERVIAFALLAAGLSVTAIGLLDLLGWLLDIPILTMWKNGSNHMAPGTAVLFVMFGVALCLGARTPQSRIAVSLSTLFGVVGFVAALLLLALRLEGVYLPTGLLGIHISGTYEDAPIGYISPITLPCFLLSYGSLLTSLPFGGRSSWRGWLMLCFGGLVSLVSFVLILAHLFGIPLIFGKTAVSTALSTCISLLIMGLAQLVLAIRYIEPIKDSPDGNGGSRFGLLRYTLVFLVFVAGIFTAAYYFYHETELTFRREVESQLLIVSNLKTDELVRWRRERLWDGSLTQNTATTAAVRELLKTPDNLSAQREIQNLLGKYRRSIGYDRAFLLDADGVTRISVPQTAEPTAAILTESAAASMRMGKIMLQDFFRDEHDLRVYLALMVPIMDNQAGNQPLGVVVLRIDPTIYLYPHIKSWPTPSATAETLLVRREGNDILFLNDLRFRADTALTLRVPLAGNTDLAAAKALLGQKGIVDRMDYRNKPVIAAVGAVPDSPWYIVTKLDSAEVYAPLRERMWLTLMALSILVCGAAIVLILLWRQQRMRFYQSQFELTSALRESEERLQFALQKSHTGGWELNLDDYTAVRTLEHDRIFGYESLLPNWTYQMFLEHVHPDDRPEVERLFSEAIAAHSDWDFECRILRRDGQERWIWAVGGYIRSVDDRLSRMAGIVQDVTERKLAEEALRRSEEHLRMSQIYGGIGTWEEDLITKEEYWSETVSTLLGFPALEKPTWDDYLETILPEDRPRVAESIQAHLEHGVKLDVEYRIMAADGRIRWIRSIGQAERDANGTPLRLRGIGQDITERKQAEEKLRLAASVFSHAREGIMITTVDGTIIDVNDAFSDITGYSRDEVLGQNPRMLSSGLQDNEFYNAMWRDLIEQGQWQGELWNRRKNGDVYPVMQTISAVRDEQGRILQYMALYTDITPLKEREQELENRAHYDTLTHLPNRVLLADRLQQGMVQTRRREQQLAVAFLDLDGFKAINDNYGHEAGDQLLVALTNLMKQALREGDTLARLGGDEFVAVLVDSGDIDDCVPILTRLLAAAAEPVLLGEITLQVSASLGVTFYPQMEDIDADQLLRQADQAMYQAKQAGKNRYHIFDAEQDSRIRSHYENLERIRRALDAGEFVLYYQPKVNMRTGTVIGVEALIRWQHPDKGLLPPDQFLPEIEDHLLGIELGEWVIDTALSQMESWQVAGLNIPVSINISAQHLQQANFAERLSALLAAHPNVRPADVELEVLETQAMDDLFKVSRVIDACRSLGVSFALDDFGTGYSSLSYLKHLPVTQLKIDQSFVRDMIDDPDDLSIVEGVIGLGAAFRLLVVAEGAETIEHATILLQLGCDLAQGYGIARPMPAQQLPGWEATWRPDQVWSESPSLGRGDLLLLIACIEHRAWIGGMEKYLKDERETPLSLDIHQCRFGQWLNTEGLARFGTQPHFQDIDLLHRQVHALAAELCKFHEQGRKQEALARVAELHGLRDALLEQLRLAKQNQQ